MSFRINKDSVSDDVYTNQVVDFNAGGNTSQGFYGVAIGRFNAGLTGQRAYATAIGSQAGEYNQGTYAIAVGSQAGMSGQGANTVAIGNLAGASGQGTYAIAIGYAAGQTSQPASSIVLNASGVALSPSTTGLFVSGLRSTGATHVGQVLVYDSTSSEIRHSSGKTFVVNHPLDQNRYLVHGCLEGPESGVYYRGTGKIEPGSACTQVKLPAYCSAFDEFTAIVTPICQTAGDVHRKIGAGKVENGAFTVYGTDAGEFNWLVVAKRAALNVEPLKGESKLRGNGPYVWLE
jgi:hypothetical protein